MSLVVSAIVINWMMLACTHLKFKQTMQKLNKTTLFPAIAYPLSNYICIVFMLGILAIMWQTPEMQIAVLLIPVWIICLSFTYWLKQKKTNIS
jgi:aromatic amino acid transport protein AroP